MYGGMCWQGCEEGEKEDTLHIWSIDGNPWILGVDRYICFLSNSFYNV